MTLKKTLCGTRPKEHILMSSTGVKNRPRWWTVTVHTTPNRTFPPETFFIMFPPIMRHKLKLDESSWIRCEVRSAWFIVHDHDALLLEERVDMMLAIPTASWSRLQFASKFALLQTLYVLHNWTLTLKLEILQLHSTRCPSRWSTYTKKQKGAWHTHDLRPQRVMGLQAPSLDPCLHPSFWSWQMHWTGA